MRRAFCHGALGRLREARDEHERCRAVAEEDGAPEAVAYVYLFAAETRFWIDEPDEAIAYAKQLGEIARQLGEPLNLVALTQLAFANAHLAAGHPADAVQSAQIAVDLHSRVEQYFVGGSAAMLAEALLAAGDLMAAETAAATAISLCKRSLRGHFEVVAQGVMARTRLRRDGASACADADAALTEAAAVIERTGAKIFDPALCEWRAELATVRGDRVARGYWVGQAVLGYEDLGAPRQVVRLKQQIVN